MEDRKPHPSVSALMYDLDPSQIHPIRLSGRSGAPQEKFDMHQELERNTCFGLRPCRYMPVILETLPSFQKDGPCQVSTSDLMKFYVYA